MPVATCEQCGKRLVGKGPQAHCPDCDDVAEAVAVAEEDEDFVVQEADAKRPCPNCAHPVGRKDVICIGCGLNLKTGKRVERIRNVSYDAVDSGFPLIIRIIVAGSCGGLLLLIALVSLLKVPVLSMVLLVLALGIAAVSGTYRRYRVSQNSKGQPLLTVASFIGFIPLTTKRFNLRRMDALEVGYTRGFGPKGLLVMLLLVFCGVIPGLIWWHYAFTKETFLVSLRERGFSHGIYEGMVEENMQHVVDMIQGVSGLQIIRV